MVAKSDLRYFKKAEYIAKSSDYYREHIGCIAVYQNHIIGIGCNLNKTHPIQKYYNRYREDSDCLIPKLHAEINCLNSIRHLDVNFNRVRLYIYRARNDQKFGLSRPCPSCMAAIKDLGIRHIYYTTNDGFAYEKLDWRKCG